MIPLAIIGAALLVGVAVAVIVSDALLLGVAFRIHADLSDDAGLSSAASELARHGAQVRHQTQAARSNAVHAQLAAEMGREWW